MPLIKKVSFPCQNETLMNNFCSKDGAEKLEEFVSDLVKKRKEAGKSIPHVVLQKGMTGVYAISRIAEVIYPYFDKIFIQSSELSHLGLSSLLPNDKSCFMFQATHQTITDHIKLNFSKIKSSGSEYVQFGEWSLKAFLDHGIGFNDVYDIVRHFAVGLDFDGVLITGRDMTSKSFVLEGKHSKKELVVADFFEVFEVISLDTSLSCAYASSETENSQPNLKKDTVELIDERTEI